jgi:hypothetical protein
MNPPLHAGTRRTFFSQTSRLLAATFIASRRGHAAGAEASVVETKVISKQPEFYHGWPTVARRQNGDLWLVWSGGRESHVCPFGQVQSMVSRDGGETWTWPRVLLDSAIDDRDTGVLETSKGTLIVTTFTSLAYQQSLKEGEMLYKHTDREWQKKKLSAAQLARWNAADARLSEAERKADLGEWCIRSTDGGLTWSPRIATVVNSPHGPIQLKDGRLLYAGKQLLTAEKRVGVSVSSNDGQSWDWLAEIPLRKGDVQRYHELHAVEAGDGTLVAQIRNHNEEHKGWILQSESSDGGSSWSEPHPVCYGFPSHLLKLRDGRLVMSYSHRRPPFGNRVRVSADNGRSWGEEILLSEDGPNGDLGYPSTVEAGDGTLLTVWYEASAATQLGVLRQARWRLA